MLVFDTIVKDEVRKIDDSKQTVSLSKQDHKKEFRLKRITEKENEIRIQLR
jgi:hypothetical protein